MLGTYRSFVKECRGCVICREKCRFLQGYGNPESIRKKVESDPGRWERIGFQCSLCGLCTSVCPRRYDPAKMFLDFRRHAVDSGLIDFQAFRRIINYEKTGRSKAFTFYHFPKGCRSVFFPGCALAGTGPDLVVKTFSHLKKQIPDLGIVLDCCVKPSHDLGRRAFFKQAFQTLLDRLNTHKISKIIVACPSCYATFKSYAGRISVQTAYEIIIAGMDDVPGPAMGTVCIHDACQTRFEPRVHAAVRALLNTRGIKTVELPDHEANTLCCGEGGSVGFVSPSLADSWTNQRLKAFKDQKAACYCAGCTALFSRKADTVHVLDLYFHPEKIRKNGSPTARPPLTYINRLMLKCRLALMPGLKHTDLF